MKAWIRTNLGRIVFALVIALVIAFAFRSETRWVGIGLVIAAYLLLFNLLRLVCLGPILAALTSSAFILAIYLASKYKFLLTGRRLHPYDVYTYGNLNSLIYFKELYPKYYIYLYAALAAAVIGGVVVLALERFRRPTRVNIVTFCVLVIAAGVFHRVSPLMDGRGLGDGNRFMHFNHQHTSTFVLSSVLSVPQLLMGNVFEYGTAKALDSAVVAAASQNSCAVDEGATPPNIVVVLRESITVPPWVEGMGAPQPDETKFRSFDGRTHRLRVETYGAGSAHTIFSLLSGISAEAFGGLKNVDVDMAPGRLRYTLPMLMKACGYRTTAITTGTEGYVAAREFYQAMGFENYTDLDDLKRLSGGDISDRAVYALVADRLSKQDTGKPNFVYVDTTISHAPYNDIKIRPDEYVPEADLVKDASIAEYIRRLVIGERDLEGFAESFRKSDVGRDRPLVVLDFGDHHPFFTKDLPGHPGYVNEDRAVDDPHLLTYFRIRGWGDYKFADLPNHPVVDVAFMSDWLLRALRFHVDGAYAYRWSLVEKCHSRYWQCQDGEVAHELHQTLRAAKLVQFR